MDDTKDYLYCRNCNELIGYLDKDNYTRMEVMGMLSNAGTHAMQGHHLYYYLVYQDETKGDTLSPDLESVKDQEE